jgi:hypothetical protein
MLKFKKKKVGFSIDDDLIIKLNLYCENNHVNKSMIVNKLIKIFLTDKLTNNYGQTNNMDN